MEKKIRGGGNVRSQASINVSPGLTHSQNKQILRSGCNTAQDYCITDFSFCSWYLIKVSVVFI